MKIKKIWFILYPLIILLISIMVIFILKLFQKPTNNTNNSTSTTYSEKATTVSKELNIYDNLMNHEYSKTVEKLLEEELFNEDYLDEYYQIDYVDTKEFANYLNILLNKNYNSSEINYIFKNFSKEIEILLDMDYIDILKYKDITNFDLSKLERYQTYQEQNDYDLKTVVTYVNIGLDLKG